MKSIVKYLRVRLIFKKQLNILEILNSPCKIVERSIPLKKLNFNVTTKRICSAVNMKINNCLHGKQFLDTMYSKRFTIRLSIQKLLRMLGLQLITRYGCSAHPKLYEEYRLYNEISIYFFSKSGNLSVQREQSSV